MSGPDRPARRAGGRPAGEPSVLTGRALALGVVALATEIVLFAGLAQLAYRLGGGGKTGIVAAFVALGLAAGGWSAVMAPTAARRLPVRLRALVCVVAGLLVGGGLVASGWTVWGVVVLVAGIACAAAQQLMPQGTGGGPARGRSPR
jgi:hypothetical protein